MAQIKNFIREISKEIKNIYPKLKKTTREIK